MEYDDWEPYYRAICRDFGYDRVADERARDRLRSLSTPFPLEQLSTIDGRTVLVAGAGPSLTSSSSLDRCRAADAVIAASTAADTLEEHEIAVTLQVTDLDKSARMTVDRTQRGEPVAIHAHGDNVEHLESVVPQCAEEAVLPTTQAEPTAYIRNFGGFTDGDRAAFIADALGAEQLQFAGWDFDDPTVGAEKARKLEWAAFLLHVLERRRTEQFSVLDGRRNSIEPPVAIS